MSSSSSSRKRPASSIDDSFPKNNVKSKKSNAKNLKSRKAEGKHVGCIYTVHMNACVCMYTVLCVILKQFTSLQVEPAEFISSQVEPAEYAIAVADVAFKHMLTLSEDPSIMISFLNCFIPSLKEDPITEGNFMLLCW
jgi:hypothetical protein